MISISEAVSTFNRKWPRLRILRCYDDGKYYSFDVIGRKWEGDWNLIPVGIESYYSMNKETGEFVFDRYSQEEDPGSEVDLSNALSKEDLDFIEYIRGTWKDYNEALNDIIEV